MNIFHYAFIATIVYGIVARTVSPENWKKSFCIFSGLIYFLIAALRSSTVGSDTWNYVNMFYRADNYGWDYTSGHFEEEWLFGVLLWIVTRFAEDYTVFLAVVAAFFTLSVWYYIYKYSSDPLLSVIIMLAFNYYQFSLTGIRQTIAIAIIIWAIVDIRENDKILRPLMLIYIASLFHTSALAVSMLVLLKYIKLSRGLLWLSIPALGGVFIFKSQICKWIMRLVSYKDYIDEKNVGGEVMTFVLFAFYIMCVVLSDEYKEKYEKTYTLDFWIAILGIFFQMLVVAQPIFFRMGFYFLIINVSFIPNALYTIKTDSENVLLNYLSYILLSIQYLMFTIGSSYVLPYNFFWQV